MLIVYYSTSEIEMTSQQGTNSLAPILEVPLYCKGFLLPLTDLLEFALCCSANYVYTSVGRVQQIVICPVPPNYRADLLTKWCTRSTFKLWSTQLSGQPVPLADAEAVDEEEEEEREFEQQLSQWKKTEVSDTKTLFWHHRTMYSVLLHRLVGRPNQNTMSKPLKNWR